MSDIPGRPPLLSGMCCNVAENFEPACAPANCPLGKKGVTLLATRDILAGETVLLEHPAIKYKDFRNGSAVDQRDKFRDAWSTFLCRTSLDSQFRVMHSFYIGDETAALAKVDGLPEGVIDALRAYQQAPPEITAFTLNRIRPSLCQSSRVPLLSKTFTPPPISDEELLCGISKDDVENMLKEVDDEEHEDGPEP